MGLLLLLIDGILVSFIANRLLGLLRDGPRHPVARAMGFLVAAALVVIASVWTLSAVGCLGPRGFLTLHGVVVAAGVPLAATRRSPKGEGGLLSGLRQILFPRDAAGAAVGLMIAILLAYALVLAVASFPGTFDSQTYRLSRVGYWLQEHRVAMHFGDDKRLYYMPAYVEFVMLWLTGFFPAGYPLVNLPQFLGGILCLLAVFELGRLAGLTRGSRLLAAALLLGLPNVFLQFSTSQSDLFMAGFLNAGLAFAWRALAGRSRADAILGGIAIGIAIGAKSTFLYWVPGLAVWFGLLWLIARPDCRHALAVSGIIALVALSIGGWKYADNLARFGNPFAPANEIEHVHQRGKDRVQTIRVVAELHFWQLLQANSNPSVAAPILRPLSRHLGDFIARSNPPAQASAFRAIRASYEGGYVYEDVVSFGVLAPLLAAAAILADLVAGPSRRAGRFSRLPMAAALLVFFAFFFTQQNPNAWNYRFFVMLGPFLAVLAGSALPVRRFGRGWGAPALAVAALSIAAAVEFQSRNILGGWRGLVHPERVPSVALFDALAGQARVLPPSARSVAVALPVDGWLAPYFRLGDGRRYSIVSLAALEAGFRSPADYLRRQGFDAVITSPEAFGRGPWAGVERSENRLDGDFARVAYSRD